MMIPMLTLTVFALAMAAMAVGLVVGKRLRGSCGGLAGGSCSCSAERARACRRKGSAPESSHASKLDIAP